MSEEKIIHMEDRFGMGDQATDVSATVGETGSVSLGPNDGTADFMSDPVRPTGREVPDVKEETGVEEGSVSGHAIDPENDDGRVGDDSVAESGIPAGGGDHDGSDGNGEGSNHEGCTSEAVGDGDHPDTGDDNGTTDTLINDPSDITSEITMEKLESMMKTLSDQIKAMQQVWLSEANELGLKPDHMKALYDLNAKNKTDPPDDATDEEKANWDYWNGLNAIEWADLEPIFGESHKCYGVDISQTRDRLKTACNDHLIYVQMMQEYRGIHDGYVRLQEEEEANEINCLEEMIKASDPEDPRTIAAQKAVERYYNLKYLGWVGQPLEERDLGRILYAMGNKEKMTYYMTRTIAKLRQLDISTNFIPELSKFEDRFLEEKYHSNSQVLLAFFVHFVTFSNLRDSDSLDRTKITCFVIGMDRLIRKRCLAEQGEAIMKNIMNLEDQFLGKTPQPE